MRLLLLLSCLAWLCVLPVQASAETRLTLRIPNPGLGEPAATGHFYVDALRLALTKSAPPGEEIDLQYFKSYVGRERMRLMVAQGSMDLMWSSSTKEREERLLAIKFNLLKGINEYRFLLIRTEDQQKFSAVNTLEDLRKFHVGGGTHWSDMQIFQAHGFHTVTSWQFHSLFKMLAAKRFDFLPRTFSEIMTEMEEHRAMNFMMEPHLILHYEQPIYFFVAKENHALARRIQEGLTIAQKDGSLDELFFSIPHYKATWEYLRQTDKKILHMEYKELPAATPSSTTPSSPTPSSIAPPAIIPPTTTAPLTPAVNS